MQDHIGCSPVISSLSTLVLQESFPSYSNVMEFLFTLDFAIMDDQEIGRFVLGGPNWESEWSESMETIAYPSNDVWMHIVLWCRVKMIG